MSIEPTQIHDTRSAKTIATWTIREMNTKQSSTTKENPYNNSHCGTDKDILKYECFTPIIITFSFSASLTPICRQSDVSHRCWVSLREQTICLIQFKAATPTTIISINVHKFPSRLHSNTINTIIITMQKKIFPKLPSNFIITI